MPKPTLHRDLPEVARDYDIVVIDGAPRVNELGRAAIMASDLVIIPVQPSPYDVWATQDVVALIREAQVYKANLRAVFVIDRKIANTAIGRDVVAALAEFGFPVSEIALCQRSSTPRAPRRVSRSSREKRRARPPGKSPGSPSRSSPRRSAKQHEQDDKFQARAETCHRGGLGAGRAPG